MKDKAMENGLHDMDDEETWKEKGKCSCHGVIGFMKDGGVAANVMTCVMKNLAPSRF